MLKVTHQMWFVQCDTSVIPSMACLRSSMYCVRVQWSASVCGLVQDSSVWAGPVGGLQDHSSDAPSQPRGLVSLVLAVLRSCHRHVVVLLCRTVIVLKLPSGCGSRQQRARAVPAPSLYQISSRCIPAESRLTEEWCGTACSAAVRQCRPAASCVPGC